MTVLTGIIQADSEACPLIFVGGLLPAKNFRVAVDGRKRRGLAGC